MKNEIILYQLEKLDKSSTIANFAIVQNELVTNCDRFDNKVLLNKQ